MKVLITGGTGFIGKTLCRRLLKAGHEVHILDIESKSVDLDRVYYHYGDITSKGISNAPFWKGVDVCFHLAAMANVNECREFKDKAFKVNLYGTFNIAEACRKHNILMVFASTACVYGNTPQHPSTEDGPTCPMDLYGVTKRAGEEIVKLLPRWLILRFGTTVGPEMRSALATYQFLSQARNNQPFNITGFGTQTRNWIYVEDLVEGCYKAMASGYTNQIFNLVGKESHTIYEVAEMCAEIVRGTSENMHVRYFPAREGDVEREDISIEKAKNMLGWEPKVSLKDALKRSYEKAFEK